MSCILVCFLLYGVQISALALNLTCGKLGHWTLALGGGKLKTIKFIVTIFLSFFSCFYFSSFFGKGYVWLSLSLIWNNYPLCWLVDFNRLLLLLRFFVGDPFWGQLTSEHFEVSPYIFFFCLTRASPSPDSLLLLLFFFFCSERKTLNDAEYVRLFH